MTIAVFTPFAFAGETANTPFGPAGPLRAETLGEWNVIWIARAGDARARVVAAKERGAVHAVGLGEGIALVPGPTPGDWLTPSDVIDQTRGTPTTFFTASGLGYLSQSPPFCSETRAALVSVGHDGGTVVAAPERAITPAEVRAWGLLGGVMAMPGLGPEWYLCRELEIGYAPLVQVCWTNEASTGKGDPAGRPYTKHITEAATRPIMEQVIAALPQAHSWAGSNTAARRTFGDDWRGWIGDRKEY